MPFTPKTALNPTFAIKIRWLKTFSTKIYRSMIFTMKMDNSVQKVFKMKHKQIRQGFELGSSILFLTMINVLLAQHFTKNKIIAFKEMCT